MEQLNIKLICGTEMYQTLTFVSRPKKRGAVFDRIYENYTNKSYVSVRYEKSWNILTAHK